MRSPFLVLKIAFCLLLLTGPMVSQAEGFSANFQNTDIREFINTVSKSLNKTVIIAPSVQGSVTIRSYEDMTAEEYYQFFLSALQVYGFSAIASDNDVLKVVPEKSALGSGAPLVQSNHPSGNDEVVMKIMPLHHVSGQELAPLLQQLNSAGDSSVVYYSPSNVIMATGRAASVRQLEAIIQRVDAQADYAIETVYLKNAEAESIAQIVKQLNGEAPNGSANESVKRINAEVVADPRTNSILVSGDPQVRKRIIQTIKRLDADWGDGTMGGQTRVVKLRYAKAEQLVAVLSGDSTSVTASDPAEASEIRPAMLDTLSSGNVTLRADANANAILIKGPRNTVSDIENVIQQLDTRRPQILVEAIIAEISNADGLNFGVQWMNDRRGGTRFSSTTGGSITDVPDGMPGVLGGVNGLAAGFYSGDWSGLVTALQSESRNNILATPSIVTLDNMEAEFTVGQEVPVLTGSQTTAGSGDNIFNTVERKEVGIKLKVTPQISQDDSVRLDIEQEVSSVAENSSNGDLGPTFDTRNVKNAVLVTSGSTVVVGGLLDSTQSNQRSKVPILGDIPVIGHLFGATERSSSKRNLMLFIRPTIIRMQDNFADVSDNSLQKFRDNNQVAKNNPELSRELDKQLQAPDGTIYLDKILIDISQFCASGCR